MDSSLIPPRQVPIGDAAAFVGITPQTIRGYHEIGLLAEPTPGSDDRRYGYDEMIRLLWIRKMADAGMAVDDIRAALANTASAGAGSVHAVADTLRRGLLSDLVTGRLADLPEGSLRQADLDTLLVTERIFGPLGAAVQAGRFITVATHPGLREDSDRVEAAEATLDDTVAVDDPRVAQVAAERHAFEQTLHAVIESSGLAQEDDELFGSWDPLHPDATDDDTDAASHDASSGHEHMNPVEAVSKMPYDFSPARWRSLELAEGLGAEESSAS
jgi:DNA-binding transcriptional MerR regulator